MTPIFIYRNRQITSQDIAFIKELIDKNPGYSRYALSKEICRAWNWVQANGHLKDMICRGLMLHLERQGYLVLPARRYTPPNCLQHRKKPKEISMDTTHIEASLKSLLPLTIQQVRRTPQEKLFNSMVEQYHYLGYSQPVGEHLKYIAYWGAVPVACAAFSSSAWHLASRDLFIGWTPDVRKKNLHLLAYNTRFLILPWVRVPYLASHLLSRFTKTISVDWQAIYNHPIYWLETIVDDERFKGTCYRAANWIQLGKTTGRGLKAATGSAKKSVKTVYAYPLIKNYRDALGAVYEPK
jgi:hypothetical protein